MQPSYVNPVVATNTPDPGVLMLPDGMGYTVVSTTNFARNATSGAFKIIHSRDLVDWTEVRGPIIKGLPRLSLKMAGFIVIVTVIVKKQ